MRSFIPLSITALAILAGVQALPVEFDAQANSVNKDAIQDPKLYVDIRNGVRAQKRQAPEQQGATAATNGAQDSAAGPTNNKIGLGDVGDGVDLGDLLDLGGLTEDGPTDGAGDAVGNVGDGVGDVGDGVGDVGDGVGDVGDGAGDIGDNVGGRVNAKDPKQSQGQANDETQ